MESWQTLLIGFGIFNLCLLVFCRPLSGLVLGFFAFWQNICSPKKAEKLADKAGFPAMFSGPNCGKASRKQAIQILAWTGGVNLLGCIAFYVLIALGQ
jgi:hypothetical protein